MNYLVTGGAGFIGCHLIDALLSDGHLVVCIDDLSLGEKINIAHHLDNQDFNFIEFNMLNKKKLDEVFKAYPFDCVFHMTANSDIGRGMESLNIDLERTFMTTIYTLECMMNYQVNSIVFCSTSAIYGEQGDKNLKEDDGPLFPISFYGAAKLSAEAYISAFVERSKMRAWIFRFPNVVGERCTHGAVYNFINRLERNPTELLLLGDGKQSKPYTYVKDLIEGILFGWQHSSDRINYFNIGVNDTTSVTTIGNIVIEEMGLENVKIIYAGGDRGWVGDVPKVNYDLSKINALGWKAKYSSDDAVRMAVMSELRWRKKNNIPTDLTI